MLKPSSVTAIKNKQIRNFILILAAVIGMLFIVFIIISGDKKSSTNLPNDKAEFASAIKHVDAGSVLIERTEARLALAEKNTENLQKTVAELNQDKLTQEQNLPQEQAKFAALVNRIEVLEQSNQERDLLIKNGSNTFPGAPEQALLTQGIRDDAIVLERASEAINVPAKNPKDYVPSGTFVKAVTLGGADASAAVNAQSNPQPMLFRIIEDGTLPNNKKSHLKGCLATAAVVGDISSERGLIRLETLSCVEPGTNKIIDLNVEGTIFGPEGKSGVRGIPVWREGALLQRAFAAGALSGLAGGIAQKYTKTSISPLGSVQSVGSDAKDIAAQGISGGLGTAMEKLADYNIRRAEQYHPVLQLSAGTIVDLVFLKGFYLNEPKSDIVKTAPVFSSAQTTTDTTNSPISNSSELASLPLTPKQIEQLKKHEAQLNG